MLQYVSAVTEDVAAAARLDGFLDFKDEGSDKTGMPVGKLTLHSSGAPVYPDGRWVTKARALRLAAAWGVELFEY
jgi:hypothetical protein